MGKTEAHQDAVVATGGFDCYKDCYKGRLRTTRDDVVAIGLAEHHKCGFCGNCGRLRIHIVL